MNLDERDLKKIKSLHVMLKMPIWILEKETNKVLKSYESIYKHPISYGFKEKNISEETVQFYSGILNEIFLCLWYKDTICINQCLNEEENCNLKATDYCPVRRFYLSLQEQIESELKHMTFEMLRKSGGADRIF